MSPPAGQELDDEKLRELMLLVAWLSEDDPTFGATKLNTLLFFADFRAYAQLGRSIAGQEYRALDHGPAPRHLVRVRDEMVRNGDLVIRPRDYFGRRQDRPIALRVPDRSRFSPEEVALIAGLVHEWERRTAMEMSEASHKLVGWRLAQVVDALEGTIPYETALFEPHEPTLAEIEHAKGLEGIAAAWLAESAD